MNTELTAAPPPAVLNGNAVANYDERSSALLPMPVDVRLVVARYQAVQDIVQQVFKDDVHFGKIPGTGDKKTLLKPGFDALCLAFQFSPDFVKQPESIETDRFINLVYKCVLTSASGRVVATGIGSCNSKEEKYRWINSARKCPTCGKEAIAKSKEEWGGGWYCNAKKDGCGAKFKKGEPSIESQEAGRKENDNAWNNHNTLTKMGQKRAAMAAIITACGLSGDFTQDVEDIVENDKARRQESDMPPVDIQGQYQPDRPYYQESHDQSDMAGNGPTDEDLRGAGDAQWQPAPAETPAMPADVLAAFEVVQSELKLCTSKEHFQKLKAFMQSKAGVYVDKRVTAQVNARYAELFPAKPATAPKGA